MWTQSLLKTKLKALAIHLSLSAVIFIPFLVLILIRWFPPPFFYTDGGWQGVRIMLAVDMVLGPTLTFLVFNPAKTRLALGIDFGFISIVQLAALAYGAYSIEHNRLRAVAFVDDAFYAVPNAYFMRQGIRQEDWVALGAGDGPQTWAYVRRVAPADKERFDQALRENLPLESMFFLYEPLAANVPAMARKATDVPKLLDKNPALRSEYERFQREYAGDAATVRFYRFFGSYRNILVGIDGGGQYRGYLDIDPYKIQY